MDRTRLVQEARELAELFSNREHSRVLDALSSKPPLEASYLAAFIYRELSNLFDLAPHFLKALAERATRGNPELAESAPLESALDDSEDDEFPKL